MNSLLIEVRHDRGIGDVGLVVPVETSVDLCGLTSALYSLDGGDHALLADADRILGNGAHLGALLIASIWALPESYPATRTLPPLPASLTPSTAPSAPPSFVPKMALRSGLAWIIDLAMSADF